MINYAYSQIIQRDIPIIINLNEKKLKIDDKQTQIKNKLTNDNININLIKFSSKKKSSKFEEEKNEYDKKNEINQEEVIVRSRKFNTNYTIIEEKLPNPYLNTELVKKKKYINFNINSRFKTKYSDYLKKKISNNSSNQEIKPNKTYKFCNKIDDYIHFSKGLQLTNNLKKETKTLSYNDFNN